MNIFVTSLSPQISAANLDDKRVVKMVLETAQMLNTAFGSSYYRPTHGGHPCVNWVKRSRANAFWLVQHGIALADTYKSVYGREHNSREVIEAIAEDFSLTLKNNSLMPFPEHFQNSARNSLKGLDFTHHPVPLSYQLYLAARWATDERKPTWEGRGAPLWLEHIKV